MRMTQTHTERVRLSRYEKSGLTVCTLVFIKEILLLYEWIWNPGDCMLR
jgi:hypothetical protein